jgi:hypothetical protein
MKLFIFDKKRAEIKIMKNKKLEGRELKFAKKKANNKIDPPAIMQLFPKNSNILVILSAEQVKSKEEFQS